MTTRRKPVRGIQATPRQEVVTKAKVVAQGPITHAAPGRDKALKDKVALPTVHRQRVSHHLNGGLLDRGSAWGDRLGRREERRRQGQGELREGDLCSWHGWLHGGKVALPVTISLSKSVSNSLPKEVTMSQLNLLIEKGKSIYGTQRALAEELGVPEQHVSMWANKKRPCSARDRAALAIAVDEDPAPAALEAILEGLNLETPRGQRAKAQLQQALDRIRKL